MSTTFTRSAAGSGVTMLGLGAMGSALAVRLREAGYPVTVWNRSLGRDAAAHEAGAGVAETVSAAISAAPLVVACLLRHSSIHETLDPVLAELRGRTLVNLTTTTPNEARELATWAARNDIQYLDGAILARPSMIGTPAAQIFYSGARSVYDQYLDVFDIWASSTYDGPDAGMASLIDLAMLSGMYQMLAGFFHGAAMVGSSGMSVADFAARSAPFISAMTNGFTGHAQVIDGGDYTVAGQQSLEFSDLSHIVLASEEQGVNPVTLAAVQTLISKQISDGHGSAGLARIYQSLRADG